MKPMERLHGYRGGYLIGFVLIGVSALRARLFYQGQSNLYAVISLIAVYGVLYSLEPLISKRFDWHRWLYFPMQTALVVVLSNLRPFLDFHTVLYFPLCIQVFRTFSRQAAIYWIILFVFLLWITIIPGMGLLEGFALFLLNLASGTFFISYDFLYLRTQSDEAESQRLLIDLQAAHQKLQDYAAQAEELAATRERNRLARELHDSVSQVIFSITLTSQSARLLLEREPTQVALQIERLQEMISSALSQLRSLIAELRSH
jgi:signal transduction histidine kinase